MAHCRQHNHLCCIFGRHIPTVVFTNEFVRGAQRTFLSYETSDVSTARVPCSQHHMPRHASTTRGSMQLRDERTCTYAFPVGSWRSISSESNRRRTTTGTWSDVSLRFSPPHNITFVPLSSTFVSRSIRPSSRMHVRAPTKKGRTCFAMASNCFPYEPVRRPSLPFKRSLRTDGPSQRSIFGFDRKASGFDRRFVSFRKGRVFGFDTWEVHVDVCRRRPWRRLWRTRLRPLRRGKGRSRGTGDVSRR